MSTLSHRPRHRAASTTSSLVEEDISGTSVTRPAHMLRVDPRDPEGPARAQALRGPRLGQARSIGHGCEHMDGRAHALRATLWALLFTFVLGTLIIIGSRNLAHFDAALVGYTF